MQKVSVFLRKAAAAVLLSASVSSAAPILVDQYGMGGSGSTVIDDIGGQNGTAGGSVTQDANGVHFPGGNDGGTNNGSYVRLPNNFAGTLTNSTFEIWTTAFTSSTPYFQPIFALGSAPGTGTTNGAYIDLSVDRDPGSGDGGGIGVGMSLNGNSHEKVVASGSALTTGVGNHMINLVFSGFSNATDPAGSVKIYLDGVDVTPSNGLFPSMTPAALGSTTSNGIGGGSVFTGDPYFGGTLHGFRVYNGALNATQIMSDYQSGPLPEPGSVTLMALFGMGLLVRRRQGARPTASDQAQ